jgi:hypothetical protein
VAWLVAATAIGAVLRVLVARQDLYADELATYWVATEHGFTGVVETVASDAEITPPLSFLLTWLATRIGRSPEIVRLPSLVAGVASIPLVYAVGRRTVGRSAGVLAAVLTVLSPFMIFYSAEARGYAVLVALLLGSTLALLAAIEQPGRVRWWMAHGALVCLAMYTHYTAVFVLVAQGGWALALHPRARRPLLAATGAAALLYLPWLPSLRADLDSPTTDTLSFLYPLSADVVRLNLGHWAVGFPFSLPATTLRDLPGLVPLLMSGVGVAIGIHAILSRRAPTDAGDGSVDRARLVLVVLLAVATPVGTLLQSAVGTNVFAVRSLAASWPYLGLAVGAAVVAARPPLRVVAGALTVGALAIGAATMLTSDFERPDFERLARFADEHPGAVIVNAAVFSPGPLTNYEVEGSVPDAPVLRLNAPAQMERPFSLADPLPEPAEVAARAVEAADGGPIILISGIPVPSLVRDVVDRLPTGYEPTEVREIGGLFDVQAVVYERDPAR